MDKDPLREAFLFGSNNDKTVDRQMPIFFFLISSLDRVRIKATPNSMNCKKFLKQ